MVKYVCYGCDKILEDSETYLINRGVYEKPFRALCKDCLGSEILTKEEEEDLEVY